MPEEELTEEEELKLKILRARLARLETALAREIRRDLRESQEEGTAHWFRWRDQMFKGLADKFTREVIVSDDGNPEVIDLSLRCDVVDFGSLPRSGQIVRFPLQADGSDMPDTEDYRVRRTRSKHHAILWIDCISTET